MLVFLGLEVHRRRAVVGAAEPRGRARREEHRGGELRLPGSALSYDCDSSKPSDFLHSHSDYLSPCPTGAAPRFECATPQRSSYFVRITYSLLVRAFYAHLSRNDPFDPLSDVYQHCASPVDSPYPT